MTFAVGGVRHRRVWHAGVEARGFCRRIRVRRVRRAARSGLLRVRLPRSAARRFARTRREPHLVLRTGRRRTPPLPGSLSRSCAPLATGRDAARRVVRSSFEPRPENAPANHRVPTARRLARLRAHSNFRRLGGRAFYLDRVTGRFTGTTDEILQWAAWKWGFDPDTVRAQAAWESRWRQSAVGDGGISFGILQLKAPKQRGTFPLSRDSTAFNADYAMMLLRHCYDGYASWLGRHYRAGDLSGCLGYYWSGHWKTPGGDSYARSVMEQLAARTWEQPGF